MQDVNEVDLGNLAAEILASATSGIFGIDREKIAVSVSEEGLAHVVGVFEGYSIADQVTGMGYPNANRFFELSHMGIICKGLIDAMPEAARNYPSLGLIAGRDADERDILRGFKIATSIIRTLPDDVRQNVENAICLAEEECQPIFIANMSLVKADGKYTVSVNAGFSRVIDRGKIFAPPRIEMGLETLDDVADLVWRGLTCQEVPAKDSPDVQELSLWKARHMATERFRQKPLEAEEPPLAFQPC